MNKRLYQSVISVFLTAFVTLPAQAILIDVSGPESTLMASASIIAAPADVRDDAAYNSAQQGFNEKQNVVLSRDVQYDNGWFSAGTLLNSHMIFLNTGPGHDTTRNTHFGVDWTFDGSILGVMSNRNGSFEVDSTDLLGLSSTIYPAAPFGARGMEGNDSYAISDNMLTVNMIVTEPGDWIRVLTAVSVPEPASLALMGLGLFGLGFLHKRK